MSLLPQARACSPRFRSLSPTRLRPSQRNQDHATERYEVVTNVLHLSWLVTMVGCGLSLVKSAYLLRHRLVRASLSGRRPSLCFSFAVNGVPGVGPRVPLCYHDSGISSFVLSCLPCIPCSSAPLSNHDTSKSTPARPRRPRCKPRKPIWRLSTAFPTRSRRPCTIRLEDLLSQRTDFTSS